MSQIVTFGNIFSYQEKTYVFLAKIDDIIYAAEILDKEYSSMCIRARNDAVKKSNKTYKINQNFLYCFVELNTNQYKGRVAHYGKPARDSAYDIFDNLIGRLDLFDLTILQKELLADDVFVSAELIEHLKDIDLPET